MLASFEEELPPRSLESGVIRGLIVPHAGWYYSGATAWSAFRAAATRAVKRAIVFGGHLSPSDHPRLWDVDAWETPFGDLECDRGAHDAIARSGNYAVETATRFHRDNGIELVLPLIKAAWPDAKFVALGMPPNAEAMRRGAAIRATLADHVETIFIGSTDLTHYGPSYGFTPKGVGMSALQWVKRVNDAEFIETCASLDPAAVIDSASENSNACCAGAVAAAMAAAAPNRAVTSHYATSHDRSGGEPRDFVGYAGMLLVRHS